MLIAEIMTDTMENFHFYKLIVRIIITRLLYQYTNYYYYYKGATQRLYESLRRQYVHESVSWTF